MTRKPKVRLARKGGAFLVPKSLRLDKKILNDIEAWAGRQLDPPSFTDAISRLVRIGLKNQASHKIDVYRNVAQHNECLAVPIGHGLTAEFPSDEWELMPSGSYQLNDTIADALRRHNTPFVRFDARELLK